MGVLSILRPRRASDQASSSSSSPKSNATDLQPLSRSTPTSPTINYSFFESGAAPAGSTASSTCVPSQENTAAQSVRPRAGILVQPNTYRPASAEATMTAQGNERAMAAHIRSISYSFASTPNAVGSTRTRRLPSTAPSESANSDDASVATILRPAMTMPKVRVATKHVAYATSVEGSVVRKRPTQVRAPLTPSSVHSHDGAVISPTWDSMLSAPMNKTATLPGDEGIAIATPTPEYSRVYYSSTTSPTTKSAGKRFGLRAILAK